jgi:hypothetical protein
MVQFQKGSYKCVSELVVVEMKRQPFHLILAAEFNRQKDDLGNRLGISDTFLSVYTKIL